MAQLFKPYVSGRQRRGSRTKKLMLVLIVVIVGMVILIKSQTSNESASAEPSQVPQVALEDVLPPTRSAARPAEEAAPSVDETVEPAEPEPEPEPEPVDEPSDTVVSPEVSVEQPEPTAADKTSLQAQQLIEEALDLRDSGRIIAARDKLNQALHMQISPQIRTGVKKQMAALADKWLFSRDVLQDDTLTGHYLVQPGNLLSTIGRNHRVPHEILMRINGIERAELLRAGQRIKVIHGPFHAVVNRSTFTLDLYLQDVYVKSYGVGLGRPEHTTPTGRWLVAPGGKMVSPTWTDPDSGRTYKASDPDYPLGSRWIGLEGIEGQARGRTGFALHGTREPETIGTQSSRGCIRLHNGDVIELYEMLQTGHSNVQVVD